MKKKTQRYIADIVIPFSLYYIPGIKGMLSEATAKLALQTKMKNTNYIVGAAVGAISGFAVSKVMKSSEMWTDIVIGAIAGAVASMKHKWMFVEIKPEQKPQSNEMGTEETTPTTGQQFTEF